MNVRSEHRDAFVQLAQDGLARRREAADLRRVDANEQLQVLALLEVAAGLDEPVEHAVERVGRIVQLRVP